MYTIQIRQIGGRWVTYDDQLPRDAAADVLAYLFRFNVPYRYSFMPLTLDDLLDQGVTS